MTLHRYLLCQLLACTRYILINSTVMQLDRFIPSRSALDVDVSSYNLLKENASAVEIPQKVCMQTTSSFVHREAWHFIPAYDICCSMRRSPVAACAERVRQASGGDSWHWFFKLTNPGLQEQGQPLIIVYPSRSYDVVPSSGIACFCHLPPSATVILKNAMPQAPAPPEGHINHLASLYSQNAGNKPAKKTFRAVPSAPERILDAPDLVDDYYLNLLDWSSTNVVSILLIPSIESPFHNDLSPPHCACNIV